MPIATHVLQERIFLMTIRWSCENVRRFHQARIVARHKVVFCAHKIDEKIFFLVTRKMPRNLNRVGANLSLYLKAGAETEDGGK